jgi:hypothetical protein
VAVKFSAVFAVLILLLLLLEVLVNAYNILTCLFKPCLAQVLWCICYKQ